MISLYGSSINYQMPKFPRMRFQGSIAEIDFSKLDGVRERTAEEFLKLGLVGENFEHLQQVQIGQNLGAVRLVRMKNGELQKLFGRTINWFKEETPGSGPISGRENSFKSTITFAEQKKYKELTEKDATDTGYQSLDMLKRALNRAYGTNIHLDYPVVVAWGPKL